MPSALKAPIFLPFLKKFQYEENLNSQKSLLFRWLISERHSCRRRCYRILGEFSGAKQFYPEFFLAEVER